MPVCTTCGTDNPDIAKFCLACGSPMVAAPPPREERRVVTALFTDIVGSTATAEELDPEDVHARLTPYFGRVRKEIERFGGTVEKFVGDAVVALWGAPVAHEDDPERAVRCALAIRDAMTELNAADDWLDLNLRVGVNTGEALVVLGRNAAADLGLTQGDVMNTAARIQSAAPVNGVLVGETTEEATRDAIEYRQAEAVTAKGKTAPVHVYEALRVREPTERPQRARGKLVGRDDELGRLLELWERVATDRCPALATLIALPGVGKSRLLEELTARVGDRAGVHWGRCLSYGEGITYWPVIEILKDAAGISHGDDSTAVPEKLGTLIERLDATDEGELRTMAAAVSNLLGEATTPGGEYSATDITRAELHWGLRLVLQLLARDRPLILVFEDLHWADPTLVELVRYLVEDAEDAPLYVIASARPELAEAAPELLRDGPRSASLRLEPLTEGAGVALLAELVGSQALAEAPEAAVLLKTAGGNPLFLEETVRMLSDSGFLDDAGWHVPAGTELPVPTSLQALITSRLDQLEPPEQHLAQQAAVVGTVFWPSAVTHLAPNGHPELPEHLRALERRDLVRELEASTVTGEQEFAFKHVLIRDVAYGKLPKGRRIELHVACAEWVRTLERGDDAIEIVAWHLERACRLAAEVARSPIPAPTHEAAEALARAGEKAERREGMREAERFYARALEVIDDADELALELRGRRGRALAIVGRVQEGQELLVEVAEAARAAARPDVRCAALREIGVAEQRQGRAADAIAHLEEACSLAEQTADPRLRIRAAFSLASVKGDVGRTDEALADLAGATALAEETDDRALRVDGHMRAGVLLFNKGDLAQAEEQFERCSALAMELGSSRDQARATYPLAVIKHLRGEQAEAERLGEEADAAFQRTGETFFQIQNLVALAQFALARDDAVAAETRLRDALPLALAEGSWFVADVYRHLAEALVRQGRVDDARELVEFAGRDVPAQHAWAQACHHLGAAVVAAATGDSAHAVDRHEQALALLEELNVPVELSQARIAYARVLRAAGDADGAREQLDRVRESADAMGAAGLVSEVERELELVGGETGAAGPAPELV